MLSELSAMTSSRTFGNCLPINLELLIWNIANAIAGRIAAAFRRVTDMSRTYSRRAWRGHWILTGALLAATLGGSAMAAQVLPRTYQAQGSVVLLASRAVSKPNGGNPYLSFSPSLTLTADVLSRELMAPATAAYLASMGYSGTYTVALAPDTVPTTGSVLLLTVTGSDQATVADTVTGVITEIRARLTRLQSGISKYNQIRVEPLSVTPQATVSMAQTLRPLAALLALGLAATFGIPWIIDAQIATRRARRSATEDFDGTRPYDVNGRPAGELTSQTRAATPRQRTRASGR
jgi:hypothetical protein